jgi:uncharacterized membrane protein
MVLRFAAFVAVLLAGLLLTFAQPTFAHKNHNEQKAVAQQSQAPRPANDMNDMPPMPRMGDDGHGGVMANERPATLTGRLMDFLGRMHPFAVHFPIALIPTSWVALLLAKRRGHDVQIVRAVIILAGVAAVGAALLGWFNAGFSLTDEDPILNYHRWFGTVLAVIVGGVAVWAWRHTDSITSRAMRWVLGFTTLLLLVQGFLGATVTHGWDHMMF